MTTNDQENLPTSDIYSILKTLAEPHNLKIAGLLETYESAMSEVKNADENRQRFEKAAEASKASAVAINLEIQEDLRSGEMGIKAAHKKRAARAGHLEDVEIYTSMVDEANLSRKSSELNLSKAATEITNVTIQAKLEAEKFLNEYLIANIAEYRPILLFVGLVADLAKSGDSPLFNAIEGKKTPNEFALDRLISIVNTAFEKDVQEEFVSSAFLLPVPSGIRRKILTPLAIKRIENEIASTAEAL